MAFEYDERGYLMVDGVYSDPRFSAMEVVKIGDDYYRIMANRIMESGEDMAKRLVPMPHYQPPAILDHAVMAMAIMTLKCAFREVPKKLLEIGRAITDEELREFMVQHGIGSDDISEPGQVVVNGIYGKRYETTITVRQVEIEANTISLERELRERGIYAWAGAPKLLEIRVKG